MQGGTTAQAYAEAFIGRVRALRAASGLSAAEMARRLGVEDETYGAFETKTLLPHHLIPAFAALTGSTLRFVLAGEPAREPDGGDRLPARPAALVMDFDGVFTDNRVLVDQDGREAVRCDRSDGLGLERLRDLGLPLLVLSKERNPVVGARCAKLRLECLQGVDDKRPALERWCAERGLDLARVVYVGNDVNDLACFAAVGCAVAVADAHADALEAADVVLTKRGGRGALRELADLLAPGLVDGVER